MNLAVGETLNLNEYNKRNNSEFTRKLFINIFIFYKTLRLVNFKTGYQTEWAVLDDF